MRTLEQCIKAVHICIGVGFLKSGIAKELPEIFGEPVCLCKTEHDAFFAFGDVDVHFVNEINGWVVDSYSINSLEGLIECHQSEVYTKNYLN